MFVLSGQYSQTDSAKDAFEYRFVCIFVSKVYINRYIMQVNFITTDHCRDRNGDYYYKEVLH